MSCPAAMPKIKRLEQILKDASCCIECPSCHQSDVMKLDGQCTLCRQCSKTKRLVYRFCLACQREWPSSVSTDSACTLPNCALRAALLSDKRIDDPESSAYGCPYFRACPDCKNLLTHSGEDCPNITCPRCDTEFCFRCLKQECYNGDEYEYSDFESDDEESETESPVAICSIVENSEILSAHGL